MLPQCLCITLCERWQMWHITLQKKKIERDGRFLWKAIRRWTTRNMLSRNMKIFRVSTPHKEWPNIDYIRKRSTENLKLKTSEKALRTWNLSRTSLKISEVFISLTFWKCQRVKPFPYMAVVRWQDLKTNRILSDEEKKKQKLLILFTKKLNRWCVMNKWNDQKILLWQCFTILWFQFPPLLKVPPLKLAANFILF